jgi:PhnB protein
MRSLVVSEPLGPNVYRTVTPYLIVTNAEDVIAFLGKAYDAKTRVRLTRSNGSLMQAEVCIGDSVIMIGETMSGLEPVRAHLFVRVADADAAHERAVEAGGTSFMEPKTMTHAGERYGAVLDPAGNVWWASAKIEEVSPEEEQRRIHELGL